MTAELMMVEPSAAARRRPYVAGLIWTAAILLALPLDRLSAEWLQRHGVLAWLQGSLLADVLKIPGRFEFTVGVALVAALVRRGNGRTRRHTAFFVLLCGAASGINEVVKWLTGRARPYRAIGVDGPVEMLEPFVFHPMVDGVMGLFTGVKNLSCPSGHASLAFATAMSLAIIWPRGARWFFAVATLTAVERFVEAAHYLSDVVFGAALGTLMAYIVWRLAVRVNDRRREPIPLFPGMGVESKL